MNRAAWLLFALFLCTVGAAAQQPAPFIHDELSGTIKEQYVRKGKARYGLSDAYLTFDIDYEYKASLLMGEPVVVCSAEIKNPSGRVHFEYLGARHTVEINRDNAGLLKPYNVDFAIAYRSEYSDSTHYVARCNTGIPGSWANDAMNVAASPNWGDFFCWMGGRRPSLPDTMPDTLGENWCKTIGDAGSTILDDKDAKALFVRKTNIFSPAKPADASDEGPEPTMRAVSVHVASFAVNYSDVVLAETKKLSAQKIAERKLEQVEKIRETLPWFPKGPAKRAADLLGKAQSKAKAMPDPLEKARTLQQALRDVFTIEEEQGQESAEFKQVKNTIAGMLSDSGEREFMAQTKQTLADALGAGDEEKKAVDAFLESQRQAAANAPTFAFAGPGLPAADTGPQDIKQQISEIDGHGGWPVHKVVFHPDGKRLLSAGGDGTVRLWDIESGAELWRENGDFSAIAISPDGRWAVITAGEGEINVLDIETGTTNRRFKNHERGVYSLAISPDGRYLYSASGTESLVTDFERGNVIRQIGSKYGTFNAASSKLISGSADFLLWHNLGDPRSDMTKAQDIVQLEIDRYKGREGQFASEDNDVISLHSYKRIVFWRHEDNEKKHTLPEYGPIYRDNLQSFSSSQDGRFILLAEGDGNVGLVDRSGLSPDRVVGQHGPIRNNDALRGDYEYLGSSHPKAVMGVALSPDDRIAASGGLDGMIRIWGP